MRKVESPNILVVDPSKDFSVASALLYRETGYRVAVASGPGDANQAISTGFTPDIVVSEFFLDRGTVIDLIKIVALKQGPQQPSLLVLSAWPFECRTVINALERRGMDVATFMRSCGIDKWLVKPVPPELLIKEVQRSHAGRQAGLARLGRVGQIKIGDF